jgi:Delta7-sterol 5-desaturase
VSASSTAWLHALSEQLEGIVLLLAPLAFVWTGVFASHFVRYVLSCGLTELAVAHVPAFKRTRLRRVDPDEGQRRREFRSSLRTGAIFGLQFLPLLYAVPQGWTQLYFDVSRFGWGYLCLSFLLALVIHDTYFYWTHRWMHHPALFHKVHLHHHESRSPTAWAAFSFHPYESLVQGGIHLLLPLVIPLHVSVLGAFVVWTNLYGAMLHCGHDVFFVGKRRAANPSAGVLSTSVEHEAHHNGARGNYGLYFSLWDRVMRTRVIAA